VHDIKEEEQKNSTFGFLKRAGFFTSLSTTGLSRRALFHEVC
jgi:hypothetical protein